MIRKLHVLNFGHTMYNITSESVSCYIKFNLCIRFEGFNYSQCFLILNWQVHLPLELAVVEQAL